MVKAQTESPSTAQESMRIEFDTNILVKSPPSREIVELFRLFEVKNRVKPLRVGEQIQNHLRCRHGKGKKCLTSQSC